MSVAEPASAAVAAPADRFESLDNAFFEIVGRDYRSVVFVEQLSSLLVRDIERYFDLRQPYPQRVLVRLLPDAGLDAPYRIGVAERGFVTLDLRWERELRLETTCFALTAALLTRQAILRHGMDAAGEIPFWLVSGLSSDLYVELRPAQAEGFVREARAAELPTLTRLLEEPLGFPPDRALRRSGYWLLAAVRDACGSNSRTGAFLRAALTGGDLRAAIYDFANPSGEAVDDPVALIEDWWRASLAGQLARNHSPFETMADSRGWLQELSSFDILLEDGRRINNYSDLWSHRADPEVRAVVEARMKILQLRIRRVNPAYLNPAQSAGVLFEVLLDPKARNHRYLQVLADHLNDLSDTAELDRDIRRALGD